jgi:hypothetical protein
MLNRLARLDIGIDTLQTGRSPPLVNGAAVSCREQA